MLNIRVKTPSSTLTLKDLNGEQTLQEFQDHLFTLCNVPPASQRISLGYPPREVSSAYPSICINSIFSNNETILLEAKNPESSQQISFHLTGFGQFQGVKENPTTTLMQELPEYLKQHPIPKAKVESFTIIETSGAAVTKYFQREDLTFSNPKTVFIHFGVSGLATDFTLESVGWNNADFRCRDEQRWMPTSEPINSTITDINHSLPTSLPLTSLHSTLQNSGFPGSVISEDPGRFVCNYIYYKSLLHSQANKTHSLFIHVPPFSVIPKEHHLAFARSVLVNITDQLQNHSNQ